MQLQLAALVVAVRVELQHLLALVTAQHQRLRRLRRGQKVAVSSAQGLPLMSQLQRLLKQRQRLQIPVRAVPAHRHSIGPRVFKVAARLVAVQADLVAVVDGWDVF